MVYVNSDGTVTQSAPWNLDRIIKLFYGIIAFFIYFFKTLVGLDTSDSKTSWRGSGSTSFRGFGGGGGGGGSRPFGPGGGGGPRGPRIRTMRDINPPTVQGGGCPGGSCGL